MFDFSTTNGAVFLKENTSLFSPWDAITIDCLNSQDEFDGYVNYLYRIKQGERTYILKQAKDHLIADLLTAPLDKNRNHREYLSYTFRKQITPTYVPQVFDEKKADHFFLMEDLKDFATLRQFLSAGGQELTLGKQIGEFLAKNHFYTSQFFLDPVTFQELDKGFTNSAMRTILTDVLLQWPDQPIKTGTTAFQNCEGQVIQQFLASSDNQKAWQNLTKIFQEKKQCLIHGDFHTSNILFHQKIQVIDMEYTMMGPFSYDLGYFLANLLSQYSSFVFNQVFSFHQRKEQQDFLLGMLLDIFSYYQLYVSDCLRHHPSPLSPLEPLAIFHEAIGFMAQANLSRLIHAGDFPDFDCIPNPQDQFLARCLSFKLANELLLHGNELANPLELSTFIQKTTQTFMKKIY